MAPCHGFPNNSRTQAPRIGLVFLICTSCTISTFALLQRFDHPTKPDGSLSFLVIGDWGRRGFFNQSHVALQMGVIGEKLDIDFVVSTGDNFYENGLIGPHDPAFEESFTKIYTAKSLQKQWYSVLGNHDYRGDAEAPLHPHLKKTDRRWFCRRSFILNTEIAEFFFIDTSPLINSYFEGDGHTYDWKGIAPRNHYIKKLLNDLEIALSQSSAKWKIVVGHHAIRSAGHHGDTHELVQYIMPLLKAYNVDMYMNGHDHCLEHISSLDSPLQYLTSGAGSKAWRGDTKQLNKDGLKFFHDGQGFMSMQLTPSDAQIVFYDVFGEVMHKWNTFKGPQYSAI